MKLEPIKNSPIYSVNTLEENEIKKHNSIKGVLYIFRRKQILVGDETKSRKYYISKSDFKKLQQCVSNNLQKPSNEEINPFDKIRISESKMVYSSQLIEEQNIPTHHKHIFKKRKRILIDYEDGVKKRYVSNSDLRKLQSSAAEIIGPTKCDKEKKVKDNPPRQAVLEKSRDYISHILDRQKGKTCKILPSPDFFPTRDDNFDFLLSGLALMLKKGEITCFLMKKEGGKKVYIFDSLEEAEAYKDKRDFSNKTFIVTKEWAKNPTMDTPTAKDRKKIEERKQEIEEAKEWIKPFLKDASRGRLGLSNADKLPKGCVVIPIQEDLGKAKTRKLFFVALNDLIREVLVSNDKSDYCYVKGNTHAYVFPNQETAQEFISNHRSRKKARIITRNSLIPRMKKAEAPTPKSDPLL